MATQNKQIKISKDTVIKSFTDDIRVDYSQPTPLSKFDVNAMANQYRTPYPPVFADDSWYLPTAPAVKVTTTTNTTNPIDSVTMATAPIAQSVAQSITNVANGQPISTKQKEDLGKIILVAIGIFVLIKIVS